MSNSFLKVIKMILHLWGWSVDTNGSKYMDLVFLAKLAKIIITFQITSISTSERHAIMIVIQSC